MEKALKIGVSVLALLCLIPMSKEAFELTRFLFIIVFGILAYCEHLNANIKQFGFYVAMLILFQPFVQIPISPMAWNFIHVAFSIIVFASLLLERKTITEQAEIVEE